MRFKILVAMLLVITAVVGIITFTMATRFHEDKKTYIHDLASVVALNTAEESHSLLTGYRERLQVYARLLHERDLSPEQKRRILTELFENIRDFVAASVYRGGEQQASIYDIKALSAAGLTEKEILAHWKDHPPPFDRVKAKGVSIERSDVSGKTPVLAMAIPYQEGNGGKKGVLVALFRLDGLLRIMGRSRLFETFLVDGHGNLLAHGDPKQVAQRTKEIWVPDSVMARSKQSEVATLEYSRGNTEMIGGFASVQVDDLLTGVRIPKAVAYIASRSILTSLGYVSLALLLSSTLLSMIWSRRVTQPIIRLHDATKEVGKGKFDIRVNPSSRDEIGDLALSFNQMTQELTSREEALKQTQAQLIQSEKLAAFGQLGAGIAHEVKNPLAGILGYVQLSMRKVGPETPLHGNLKIIEKETKRCKTIIDNLLKFTRQEVVDRKPIEVNGVIEDTSALVEHQLGMHQIRLEKSLAEGLLPILGNANQLQQVLLNLILNAQQAMEGKPGVVRLETETLDGGWIEVRVRDTGPGIPKEIQSRLFDPFFTTKPAGKGTGLGLSVSYGIVRDHEGEIRVESEPGEGALFRIRLPALRPGESAGNGSRTGRPEEVAHA
jgi:signal transduction histidine kinase